MSRAGLKQIVFCDKGTLATTPVNPIAIGTRAAAMLDIDPHKTITDYRGRQLRNMTNMKAEFESYQSTMLMLKSMFGWTNLNCDVQMLTTPQSSSAGSEDVFKFVSPYLLGLDFECEYSTEKRSLKAILEGAYEYETVEEFLTAADSDTPITVSGITGDGTDFTRYHGPRYLSIQSPSGAELFTMDDFLDRKLSIKTENKKDAYNRSIVDWVMFTLELTSRNASIAKALAEMAKVMSPQVIWKEANNAAGTLFDQFVFNANILTRREEFSIGDEERSLKLIFEAKAPIYDCVFTDGTTASGDELSGTGIKGGTLTVG